MKYCSTCAQFKPDKKFHKWSASRDGMAYGCQDCRAKYMRAYYQKNKDKIIAQSKKYYSDNKIVDLKEATG